MTATFTHVARWLGLHPGRLLVAPHIEVIAVAEGRAEAVVHGLVCGLCSSRTRAALLRAPGVEAACVDLDTGTARLELARGAAIDVDAMQRSLDRVVIAVRARRLIARIAAAWRAWRALHPRAMNGRSR